MLKAYTYKPEEAGFKEWPPGILRLNHVEHVEDPSKADIFIVPAALMHMRDKGALMALKYIKDFEDRHVFFDVSDYDQVYHMRCRFIRCNLKKFMREADPNSIPWAWPVDNFADIAMPPLNGFVYDVSFHGWISTQTRADAAESCLKHKYLKCDMAQYKDFYGYVHRDNRPEADRRMACYKNSLHLSRVALCGESIPGVFPYRFFEAMSAGRVAALFSSDYNLPFQPEIPWNEIVLQFKREDAKNAGELIRKFIDTHNDEQIINMGARARTFWLRYLNRDDWPSTMQEAVAKVISPR